MHCTYCSSGVTSRLLLGGVSVRFEWLAVAAILGVRLRAPILLKEDLLVDNGLEVGSLLVPVLNGFVVGDLNAVHLQLEVVPWEEKHFRTSTIHN